MSSLLDILGNNAEDADTASSAACVSCSGKPLQADLYRDLPAFGFSQKLEIQRLENPDVRIDGYILFGSHTDALSLFEAANTQGFNVRISPTPRMARASCGIALLVPVDQTVAVYELALQQGIDVENLVALPNQIDAKRDRYC